jgi:hypothetical protein
MNYGVKFCVKYNYELSNFVGRRKVVRQACSLIPYLFNIFVADCIHCIRVGYNAYASANDRKDVDTCFVVNRFSWWIISS